ncbi:MAG: c-type cytochrome [Phormidesmis sp.]
MQEQSVPNQFVESKEAVVQPSKESSEEGHDRPVQRVLLMVAGLLLLLCLALWGMYSLQTSDPYIQSVLQLSGDAERGHDIFQLNCATCHGLEAAGEVGPNLHDVAERKSPVALIQQVISGQTPPMPQFQPNERDMADLLSFLETL